MNEPEKVVELLPNEWTSEREKPHEPIFGPGWPMAAGVILGIILTVYIGADTFAGRLIGPVLGAVAGSIFAAFQR